MYYLLLCVAVIFFATQFLFNQKWQNEYGDSQNSALIFTLISSAIGFAAMLPVNGFKLDLSPFSFLLATLSAINGIAYTYVSIKAFNTVNLSVYSVFAMLGGMLLPFLYGIIFENEALTVGKITGCLLIALSLLFTVSKGKSKGGIYYALVFTLNGLSGVIAAIHQGNANAVSGTSFTAISKLASVAICAVLWAATSRKVVKISKTGLLYSVGFAILCTFGNLLALISLEYLPASVQYPIITGGVMVVSLVISILRKEKITKKNVISAIIAFAATIAVAI